MEEIYWITRLDGINVFLIIIMVVGLVLTIISATAYIVVKNEDYIDGCWSKFWVKLIKCCFPTTIIVALLLIFIPTTNEALMIWGVGGTIDYVKSNDSSKQLPDKCIKALDKWVGSLNEDNKDKGRINITQDKIDKY